MADPTADLASTREALAARQRVVLDDLLAGRRPDGFDARGTAMTTRVLHRKRSDAALRAAEELEFLPDWRPRFHAWAADQPQAGCAHDDVQAFVGHLRQDVQPDTPLANWHRLHGLAAGPPDPTEGWSVMTTIIILVIIAPLLLGVIGAFRGNRRSGGDGDGSDGSCGADSGCGGGCGGGGD